MGHGRDAALDLRYGRQGGYRTDAGPHLLAELAHVRGRALADGTWPRPDGGSSDPKPCTVCGKPRNQHGAPCRYCGRAPEHHADGDVETERAGKRLMAEIRRDAGSPLNDLDVELLADPTLVPALRLDSSRVVADA